MRGIQTPVSEIRHKIFTEIARVAYESDNINDSIEAIPFKVCPGDIASYRESIFHERAIASERVRLAMGMSLRPADHVVHVTSGLEESNIAEKYYEPPLINIIKFACHSCPENRVLVTEGCQGCLEHPCMEVCPKNIPIPQLFGLYNNYKINNNFSNMYHNRIIYNRGKSSDCLNCHRCEKNCPQHIAIPDNLKKIAAFEK